MTESTAFTESTGDVVFTPSTVAGVVTHMNADHPHDSLTIVRSLGGRVDAVAASVVTVSAAGVTFSYGSVDGAGGTLVIPWTGPITDRVRIRHELVAMVERAY